MSVTDPIADMFTRIRNAHLIKQDDVVFPFSKMKLSIIKILKEEGFIKYYEVLSEDLNKKQIKVGLKYTPDGRSLISKIERVSKPGKRVFVEKHKVPKVMNGFGICVLSTSKGVVTGRNARLTNVGGELLGIIS